MKRKKHNPERRAWRGRSHKKGGQRVSALRDAAVSATVAEPPELPEPPSLGKCAAFIDDWVKLAYRASIQRITVPGVKPCSRRAKETVGHLALCGCHARMAREGLIDENGNVASRADIANVRKYPKGFPNGIYNWAKKLREDT
jgi:hypothetical protein